MSNDDKSSGRIHQVKSKSLNFRSRVAEYQKLEEQDTGRLVEPKVIHSPIPVEKPPSEEGKIDSHGLASPDEEVTKPRSELSLLIPDSPSPIRSFEGIVGARHHHTAPPDTHGAVGQERIVAVTNNAVEILDLHGEIKGLMSLNHFWDVFDVSVDAFDPRVVFDVVGHRFILISAANRYDKSSGLLLAVTKSTDPYEDWACWFFPLTDFNLITDYWLDYPEVGFSRDKIVVSGLLFPLSGQDETEKKRGGTGIVVAFGKESCYFEPYIAAYWSTQSEGGLSPAVTLDADVDDVYLLETGMSGLGEVLGWGIFGSFSDDEDFIRLESLFTSYSPDTWSTDEGNFAPQKGTSHKIETGDSRMRSVVFRHDSVWFTHTVYMPAGGNPTRSSVRWGQIDKTGVIQQTGFIDDKTSTMFYAYPSLAVNKNKDVLIGFSIFSENQYAGAGYSIRSAFDPPDILRLPYQYKSGESPYYLPMKNGRNRWGDYSATVVDAKNDLDFWTVQEYAPRHDVLVVTDQWSTYWAKVPTIPAPIPEDGKVIVGGKWEWIYSPHPSFIKFVRRLSSEWGARVDTPVDVAQGSCFIAGHGQVYGYESLYFAKSPPELYVVGGAFLVTNETSKEPLIATWQWGEKTTHEIGASSFYCRTPEYGDRSYGYQYLYLGLAPTYFQILGGRFLVQEGQSLVEVSSWGERTGNEQFVSHGYCASKHAQGGYGYQSLFLKYINK